MNTREDTHSGGRVGMWLFIATELILFGGMFLLYSMYRLKNPVEFHAASMDLNRVLGTLNTVILISSSLTVALSIVALERGKKLQSVLFLGATIACAFGFLIVKSFEWTAKFHHGLYPNAKVLLSHSKGENLFFGLYYMMTGLHGVHVLVGIGVLSVILVRIVRGTITPQNPIYLINSGLYWHLVDIIWIFLFPLFYLIT
jgi:cytochrome c oxidase subunit III